MTLQTLLPAKGSSFDAFRAGVHIARVVSVDDPEQKARVQVVFPALDPESAAPIWARVAVPFAGNEYGAYFIPDVGTEVLVAFVAGDVTAPIVVGNMWNGATEVPERAPNGSIERWSFSGKNGTRISIDESGAETIELSTPTGILVRISESGGGEIELKSGSEEVFIRPTSISVNSANLVSIKAPRIELEGAITITGETTSSGTITCQSLITTSVVSASYSQGVGNLW